MTEKTYTKADLIEKLEIPLDLEALDIKIVREGFRSEKVSENEMYLGEFGGVGFSMKNHHGHGEPYCTLYIPRVTHENTTKD
jgi:hypothetical protein